MSPAISVVPAPKPGRPGPTNLNAAVKALPVPKVHFEMLPNGVGIVTHSRPQSGVVDFKVGFSAGGYEDPKGKEGIAHLVEHLAFEGTPNISHKEIFQENDAQGAYGNAATGLGQTEFTTTVAVRDAKKAISRIADQVLNPNVGRYALEREKRIVQQEMRVTDGNRDLQAAYEDKILNFGNVPEANLILGSNKSIQSITPGDVKKFLKNNYTGKNVVVHLDGDPRGFNLPLLRKELSKLPAGDKQTLDPPPTLTPRKGALLEMIPDPGNIQSEVTLTTPNFSEKGPLGFAGILMGSVLSEKVNNRIRERERLSYGASAASDGVLTQVTASLHPDKVAEGVEQMARAVKTLPQTITQEEVSRAKRQVISQLLISGQDPGSYSESLYNAMLDGSVSIPEPISKRIKKIQRISTKDVIEAAKIGLDTDNIKVMVTGTLPKASQIQAGLDAAKLGTKLKQVKFDESRYKAMYSPQDGKIG